MYYQISTLYTCSLHIIYSDSTHENRKKWWCQVLSNMIIWWISECNIAITCWVRLPWCFDRHKSSVLCRMQLSLISSNLVNTPHYTPWFCSKLLCQMPFPCYVHVIARPKVEPDKIEMNNLKWPHLSLHTLDLKKFKGCHWSVNRPTNSCTVCPSIIIP